MSSDTELMPVGGEPPADARAQAVGPGSGSTSFIGTVGNSPADGTNNNEPQEQMDTSSVEGGQNYIDSFRPSRHLVPHWRNVLSPSRVASSASISLLWFGHGTGIQDRQQLRGSLHPASLAKKFTPDSSGTGSLPQAVFVRDISSGIINTLGPTFNLSPETFEAHLVQSGYTASSYSDPDPSTWPTRFLCRAHVSLQWFSVVLRKDMEPRDEFSRHQLLETGLRWSRESKRRGRAGEVTLMRHNHELHTSTNIFRREWPLSSTFRPPKRKLQGTVYDLVEIGEDDASSNSSSTEDEREESNIVAWEERVTFCWGSCSQRRCPIVFFDPLPQLVNGPGRTEPTGAGVTPFLKRPIPRRPPTLHLDSNPATLQQLGVYSNATEDACSDVEAWLEVLARDPGLAGCTTLDLQLLAVFNLVRQDTIIFLEHVDRVLDQISAGSMDETLVQEQLGHWRALLGRFQNQLPALDKSIRGFFSFPYTSEDRGPPPELITGLAALGVDFTRTVAKCEETQQGLRAEMSLLESKRGIEEAESVSRLTELAFLFIPTTFAASLFSMQVRELVESPPPVYAFIITAIVIVSVSYGLRLIQRSTVVSGLLLKTARQIRTDQKITSRDIPARKIFTWVAWKLRGRPLIIIFSCCILAAIIAPLWTREAMDLSFRAAMTGLLSCSVILAFWVFHFATSSSTSLSHGGHVTGFGRVWQRVSEDSPGDAEGGRRAPASVIHT
ncbi:uncharacterized protein B0H64DRAFT_409776 [Chaetomium fimeti]|uniref:Uncharacterized protein n=1 Tax=Chaetomium fimeti TaxID=1854472 RepID=A0AAE0H6Y0_9PEZI|nr:hypothetical protein B0H64DRAFT_409776 [Chaetomium fimeti]